MTIRSLGKIQSKIIDGPLLLYVINMVNKDLDKK